MAAGPTYNWIIRCRCDNPSDSLYHCNTCGEKLCSNCKEAHIESNDRRNHSVVEYVNKLSPDHVGSLLCHDHKDKDCIYWCQTCAKAACIDCVTSLHLGHMFAKLETIIQEKRNGLQDRLHKLESTSRREWEGLMEEAKQATAEFLDKVNGTEKELEERAKEFHQKVEQILESSKKQLKEMVETNIAILHKQEKIFADGLKKVEQEIKEYEDRLRYGEVESVLQYNVDQKREKEILPKLSSVHPPVFVSSKLDTQSLTEMFGKLTIPESTHDTEQEPQSQSQSQPPHDTSQDAHNSSTGMVTKPTEQEKTQTGSVEESKSTSAVSQDTPKGPSPGPAPPESTNQLVPSPFVESEFNVGYILPSIAHVTSGRAWIQTADGVLKLMDRRGIVCDTIETRFYFEDVAVSNQGNILLCDTENNCINSVLRNKSTKTLFKIQIQIGWFKSQCKSYGLCCLQNGEIAVTFADDGRVVIFSMSGKVIQELDRKLFKHPYRIAENKINSDLCIVDKADRNFISVGKVIALGKDNKVRYEYTGIDKRQSFIPCGLCTDDAGQVLVTDFDNQTVHILDKDGKFRQYLLTGEQGLRNPVSINVDNEGNAWVGQ